MAKTYPNIELTQVRSGIGSTARQKRTLFALGLRRLHRPRVHTATPTILGMVEAVRHLVRIREDV